MPNNFLKDIEKEKTKKNITEKVRFSKTTKS